MVLSHWPNRPMSTHGTVESPEGRSVPQKAYSAPRQTLERPSWAWEVSTFHGWLSRRQTRAGQLANVEDPV